MASTAMALPVWSNAGWVTYTSGGSYYWDPLGDSSPDFLDLIGTDPAGPAPNLPTLYWFLDQSGTVADTSDDVFMFRMRVDEMPPGPGTSVYQVAFQTDFLNGIDWVLQVDYHTDNQVELQGVNPGGPTWNDVGIPKPGPPDNNPYEWTGSLTDWSRWVDVATEVPGYTALNGTSDYFLDVAVPWQDFATAVGLPNQQTPIALAATTSTVDMFVNKDVPAAKPGSDGQGDVQVGDPIIPEPSTVALLGLGLVGLIARRRRKAE